MTIETGQDLLHYRLAEKLGEGGMGVVWKALDTTLDREVAIKILPQILGDDSDRLARFEREAKVLASLNHPNIAAIYSFESATAGTETGRFRTEPAGTETGRPDEDERTVNFLVMELVEGEDLSKRISRRSIPIDEAMPMALQIAQALEAAHEKGIIHRDLKPANIRIDDEGNVKVLDFGLAKAFDADPASGSVNLSMSPTLTSAGTMAGMILGTASYMAPEQARGKPVDRRADIWAFGCVLYEMLSGQRLFRGETVSDILAAVLKTDPGWDDLPVETPPSIRRLLRRCLTRDPKDRLRDVADARLELEEAESEPHADFATLAAPGAESTPAWKRLAPWAIAAAALGLAAVGYLRPVDEGAQAPAETVRFQIDIGSRDLTSGALPFNVSSDGATLAYAVSVGTSTQIFLRPLDAFEGTPLPGTEDGHAPFFSPDGQWLGFFSNGQLKKLSLLGGDLQVLCSVPHAPGGADWAADGRIIFAMAFAGRSGLFGVSENGGEVEELAVPLGEEGERYFHWPQILPDQTHVLFTIRRGGREEVAILSLETGERRLLPEITGRARFVTSGHLLYGDSETLMAVPFDLDRLEPTGTPVPVLDGLPTLFGGAGFNLQISQTGLLAYFGTDRPQQRMVWVDRVGEITPLPLESGAFHWPKLSPDGKQLSITIFKSFESVVYNLERGGRVQFDNMIYGLWEPDSLHFIYTARGGTGVTRIQRRQADGGGESETLLAGEWNSIVTSVSNDGRFIAYYQQHPETSRDLWVLDLESGGPPEPLLVTSANERSARFSPDGRWIAYTSNRSGRNEVYLRRFEPRGDTDILISTDGGREPVWRQDGRELFYRAGKAMLAVPIDLASEPSIGVPQILFEGNWAVDPGGLNQMYDVTPDGEQFLMIQNADDLGLINIVTNWSPGD